MDIDFLRFYDRAKSLTGQEGNQTPPQQVFESLMRLLEIADQAQVSKRNKFHARTLYLEYLMESGYFHLSKDELLKIGLSCLYTVLQTQGMPQEISDTIQFATQNEYAAYYLSDKHTHLLATLNEMNTVNNPLTTPYDFIELTKGYLSMANFQNAASTAIDLALTLPEASVASAEDIFVASCLFIQEQSLNESLIHLIAGQFALSIGAGLQIKMLLNYAYVSILQEEQ